LKKIGIVGKRYEDIKLYTDSNQIGESNNCSTLDRCLGGMYNFRITGKEECTLVMVENGVKKAYIIEDSQTSTRTSYTYTSEPSIIDDLFVDSLNYLDWVHFAYLDDLDDVSSIQNIQKPYSIDFCMNKDRLSYVKYIDGASVVFDSRERKKMYDNVRSNTPIILHDEKGCEVIVNGEIVSEHFCETLKNISVNGAGDVFAKFFLESHISHVSTIENASKYALNSATSFLKIRSNK